MPNAENQRPKEIRTSKIERGHGSSTIRFGFGLLDFLRHLNFEIGHFDTNGERPAA
jgi:hypothetical protein